MGAPFANIVMGSGQVDPRMCVEKGTDTAAFLALAAAVIGTLIAVVASMGILLIVPIVMPFVYWYVNRKAVAMIHGSGIKVGEKQFPEINACVTSMAKRLGLARPVEVYVVEDNVANAVTVRYGKKNVILLTDDLIYGCLSSKPEALAYVIGHELGHIALKHTGMFRSWMRQHYKKLGRLDEYSADRVALALVGDKGVAMHGLLILTVGHTMVPYVNEEEVVKQAQEVAADKYSQRAEKTLTHPLLLNRLIRVFQPEP